ncbi:hypothetical protein HK105_204579 [Polyrhizophydium stewartii]|uniref:Gamma-glutamylcyclotransferase n=1 Tax=Polyrhizophydium stewartii TaxID=2732419 RepID=A0ABR4N8M1_9FUNG
MHPHAPHAAQHTSGRTRPDGEAAAGDSDHARLRQALEAATEQSPLHLVFGYGSLVNPTSRLRTFAEPTAAVPAVARGLRRSWSYRCARRLYTAVAVERTAAAGAAANGVLVAVPRADRDLPRLDEREAAYERVRLPFTAVACLRPADAALLASHAARVVVWVYALPAAPAGAAIAACSTAALRDATEMDPPAADAAAALRSLPPAARPPSHGRPLAAAHSHARRSPKHTPCRVCPIPQSYVDCIIDGCLRFGVGFAADFIATTHGWDGVWIDDRNACAAVRKYVQRADIGEACDADSLRAVDALLAAMLPAEFAKRLPPPPHHHHHNHHHALA